MTKKTKIFYTFSGVNKNFWLIWTLPITVILILTIALEMQKKSFPLKEIR